MKDLNFMPSHECVKIETKEQYNQICHHLRNARERTVELEQPIYLEYAQSVNGMSIGIIHNPVGTWSGEPLRVKTFKEATK